MLAPSTSSRTCILWSRFRNNVNITFNAKTRTRMFEGRRITWLIWAPVMPIYGRTGEKKTAILWGYRINWYVHCYIPCNAYLHALRSKQPVKLLDTASSRVLFSNKPSRKIRALFWTIFFSPNRVSRSFRDPPKGKPDLPRKRFYNKEGCKWPYRVSHTLIPRGRYEYCANIKCLYYK